MKAVTRAAPGFSLSDLFGEDRYYDDEHDGYGGDDGDDYDDGADRGDWPPPSPWVWGTYALILVVMILVSLR